MSHANKEPKKTTIAKRILHFFVPVLAGMLGMLLVLPFMYIAFSYHTCNELAVVMQYELVDEYGARKIDLVDKGIYVSQFHNSVTQTTDRMDMYRFSRDLLDGYKEWKKRTGDYTEPKAVIVKALYLSTQYSLRGDRQNLNEHIVVYKYWRIRNGYVHWNTDIQGWNGVEGVHGYLIDVQSDSAGKRWFDIVKWTPGETPKVFRGDAGLLKSIDRIVGSAKRYYLKAE
ncbi:MAG: hypothetical protein U5N86_04495 [Planctomycetota bacterium]|nr:hypothetical protein [Planctomycetota bacterium]